MVLGYYLTVSRVGLMGRPPTGNCCAQPPGDRSRVDGGEGFHNISRSDRYIQRLASRSRSCLPWLGFTGCNLGPHFTSLVQINNTTRQIDIVFRFPLAQIAQSINFLPLVVKRRMDSMWNWFFLTKCLFLLHILHDCAVLLRHFHCQIK